LSRLSRRFFLAAAAGGVPAAAGHLVGLRVVRTVLGGRTVHEA